MKTEDINNYLRNKNNRFEIANYSYDKDAQYQIIDRETGKHYYYKNIEERNKAFKKLVERSIIVKSHKRRRR